MSRIFAAVFLAFLTAASAGAAEAGPPFAALTGKLQWRSIGPYIGGRVVAVAGVASIPNLFYMGAVQGGIWRSTNYGQNWENISDGQLPRAANSIGALAVAPSNPRILYAGTGESDIRQDFETGEGIYKSTDAGKTWHYAGLRETHTTASLAVDPRNPNIVYAASLGHAFKPNSARGLFKTTDGGKTWSRILFVDDRTGANSVSMDPHNPNVLYVSMWQEQRTPWTLVSGGPGSGLYKTTDGGAHWRKISSNPGFARGPLGKIGVSVSGGNSRVVYAIVQAHDGGVFRSSNGGATWKHVNAEWKLRQRAFYYMAIYADPVRTNVAYAPQVDGVFKTVDGGKTWSALSAGGGDHHIIWINPRHTNILLEGDDAGAWVSVDGGKTSSTQNNQPTGQFYHIALDDQFPYHVYGAQQDEGAYEGPSASSEGLTLGSWHQVAWGESTFVAPDANDRAVTFGSGYFSFLSRFNTPTGENKNVSPWPEYLSGAPASEMKYRFGWSHPIFFSPAVPHPLLVAAQVVFESGDEGATWNVISPDLTRNDRSVQGNSGGPVDLDQVGTETYPFVSALAVSPLDSATMWAGSSDGLVHVTTNSGASWRDVTPPALPQWAEITCIEPATGDRATAYLTAWRYQWDDFQPYVFKTADYGAHWQSITAGLPPDQYVFAIRQDPRDPRVVFAGTRSSVYVSLNGGASWQSLALNLPGVQVRDIAIDARQGQVAIATHGRGFWILDNLALLEQLAASGEDAKSARLFAPETAWLSHAYGGGSGGGTSGQNPQYGAAVFFNVPHGYDGRTRVTLSFYDALGKLVRAFVLHKHNPKEKKPSTEAIAQMDHVRQLAFALRDLTTIDPGMNEFIWDLRYGPAAEVTGYHIPTTDDIDDGVNGPTVVPGTYTAVLTYGATALRQSFRVALDPRVTPPAQALESRLSLALQIHSTLDALNGAIDAALANRPRLSPARRTQLDRLVLSLVPMGIQSSEGDSLNEVRLRDHLAFLMNELDMAYAAPTAAEYATYEQLRPQAQAAIAALTAYW
ncbi:MAG TPA: hypothetical protein VGZ02_09215 [Candidatus Baltobacteraceae bacterium]|jgi:photosystem II stability/assembly factor-like uncharacterized protein|nr:hypothetical protein [Candidatus Baltobacteraceae bacterium]